MGRIKRLIKHIRRWNIWRKNNLNSPIHKLFVLLGIVVSPTFCATFLPEDEIKWRKLCEENADKFTRVNYITSDEFRAILKRAEENK